MINPPKRQGVYPDRDVDCQEAMEPMFQTMVEEMFVVGWSPVEINIALRRLINANRSARIETAKLEADLAIVRAMERAKR
ncbi:hypothetical protein [Mesorhizobium sp. CAU 1732]|uniref:hypothetical protein n=1 Tax=Mesorhizobium sp. CAU 1732 TaxID=3140358 RepID=UPI0032619108